MAKKKTPAQARLESQVSSLEKRLADAAEEVSRLQADIEERDQTISQNSLRENDLVARLATATRDLEQSRSSVRQRDGELQSICTTLVGYASTLHPGVNLADDGYVWHGQQMIPLPNDTAEIRLLRRVFANRDRQIKRGSPPYRNGNAGA